MYAPGFQEPRALLSTQNQALGATYNVCSSLSGVEGCGLKPRTYSKENASPFQKRSKNQRKESGYEQNKIKPPYKKNNITG